MSGRKTELGTAAPGFAIANLTLQAPKLAESLKNALTYTQQMRVYRQLLLEEVPLRDIETIASTLLECSETTKDPVLLAEYVRIALKRYISHKFSAGQNMLPAYLLSPSIEDEIRTSIRQTSGGSYLALDPQSSKRIVQAVKLAVGDIGMVQNRPVLLTSMDIRRYVRKLVEQDLGELAVLSYQELTQDINIQPLARIEL